MRCWPASVCFCRPQELLLSRISNSSKDFQGTSDNLLPATKEASTKFHLLEEQGVFLTPSCQRSTPVTGRMRGATQTTTQTSGQRPLRRLPLRLYSVQASNLKQAVKNSQSNLTELSKAPSTQLLASQLNLQQLPNIVFHCLFHSEDSSNQPCQVQQASWHTPFFRGNASHRSNNSRTTANLPPLLLQDVNPPRQQAQRDQPQLPGEWM